MHMSSGTKRDLFFLFLGFPPLQIVESYEVLQHDLDLYIITLTLTVTLAFTVSLLTAG